MASFDIYANCNFTRSGYPDIRFNAIIKVSKETLERLRSKQGNEGLSDGQLLGNLAEQAVPVLYPVPGASFSIGCDPYPAGQVPAEIEGRGDGVRMADLTFWSMSSL